MTFEIDELQSLAILEGLPASTLMWLSEHGTKRELAAGDRLFSRGDPAQWMFFLVLGSIQRYEEVGGQWLVVHTTSQGQVSGMLPFSRMTHYPGTTVATEPSKVLLIDKDDFNKMLAVSHELGRRLVAQMSNRVREDVRLEQQREKMLALGRLCAGLAHELNNPMAAIRRTSDSLLERVTGLSTLILTMAERGSSKDMIDCMVQLWQFARNRDAPEDLSPLDRSDREEEMALWLEKTEIANAWDQASIFTGAGLSVNELERFASVVSDGFLADSLTWVAGSIEIDRMVGEISGCAGRVSELVSSVKTYSHMDRSPEHKPTDVRIGLDDTLVMLGHRLKEKNVRLSRHYPKELPTIPGNAGELNQVWTNLIDNALDALPEKGDLDIEVEKDHWGVIVKIIDNGEGIPDDIQHRIFDPFFTTKGVGEGMGLGLDISRRIVHTHGGQIEARSRRGQTEMYVRLPIAPQTKVGG